ncbi:uncharacterized protein LOC144436537 [Glandiceps talaboti]
MAYRLLNDSLRTTFAPEFTQELEGNFTVNVTLLPNRTSTITTQPNAETDEALLYIVAVLLFYAFSLTLLLIKYIKSENEDMKLSYLYEAFVKREDFEVAARKVVVPPPPPPPAAPPPAVAAEAAAAASAPRKKPGAVTFV